MKYGKILLLSFVASMLIWVIKFQKIPLDVYDITALLGRSVGWTLGLFLIPVIISNIIKGISYIFRRNMSELSFNKLLITLWIVFAIMFGSNIINKDKNKTIEKPKTDSNINTFIEYVPKKSDYKLKFKSEPTLSKTKVKVLGKYFDGEVALSVDKLNLSVLKSEYYILGEDIVRMMNEYEIEKMLKEYSEFQGYKNVSINYEENELGNIGSVRGYKILSDPKGNELKTIYQSYHYFKDNHLLSLYGASPSFNYPTPNIMEFFRSVKTI